MKYVITVDGIAAAPQGSKSYIGKNKLGRGMMIESCKRVKPWRNAVRVEAKKVISEIINRVPVHIFWFNLKRVIREICFDRIVQLVVVALFNFINHHQPLVQQP